MNKYRKLAQKKDKILHDEIRKVFRYKLYKALKFDLTTK